jgi:PAS domain S-box-containing protein
LCYSLVTHMGLSIVPIFNLPQEKMNAPACTLLIVEDFAPDRELYRRALSQDPSCAYHLLEAESVEAGLELCRSTKIDAILLDYSLPDADGLEFLAALGTQHNGIIPPVVMVTGMGDEGVAVKAMKLGAADYLVKWDLTPQILQSTMRIVIENTRLRLQLQQSQDWLQAKNQQITTIWESMTDAYVTIDRDWRVIYTNLAATEIYRQTTGLTPAEYLGESHWEVFPATVGTIVEQEYRRAVTDRVAVHFEVLYEPTQVWFEIHAYPSEMGLGVYFRDINERKRSEAERLQAERERDRFFDLSLDLLAIANFEGYFIRLNPAWEQTLGFTAAELMAQPYLDLVHPDDLAATLASAQGLSAGQTLLRFENRYRCKDGSYRWLSWSSRPYDEQNLVYAVAHDITDRKQTEIDLQIGEELFRSTFENTSVGMAHVAIDGNWMRVNHKLCEILGYGSAELLATTYQAITAPADADEDVAVVERLVNGEINECTLEKRYIHKQGHHVWANLTVTLIRTIATDGQLGIPQYFIAVIQDITDRKQLEAQLRQRELQLQLFVKYVPVGVAMFDRDMCYLSASDVWLDCHELCDRDIVGRSHYDLYPDLPQQCKEIHQRCLCWNDRKLRRRSISASRWSDGLRALGSSSLVHQYR